MGTDYTPGATDILWPMKNNEIEKHQKKRDCNFTNSAIAWKA